MKQFTLFLLLSMLSSIGLAVDYQTTGQVAYVVQTDPGRYGVNTSHFAISGFGFAGDCIKNDGLVAIAIKDVGPSAEFAKSQLAIVLSAYQTGATVHVRLDTDYKNEFGMCYGQLIMLMPS